MDFSSWDAVWASLGTFLEGPWGVPLKVLLIIVVAVLARLAAAFVVGRVVGRIVRGAGRRGAGPASPVTQARVVQRTRALGGILGGSITAVIVIVALVLVIATIVPNAAGAFGLITAALGAGLGFGAQGIVRDVLNGIFLVAEDQFGVGDEIDLGSVKGVVETVGIRAVRLRDAEGRLWIVPNGTIDRVGNLSHGNPGMSTTPEDS